MTVLGIETSTSVCSVGLANEFNLIGEKSLKESHIHSEKILTLIKSVCNESKIDLSKIDGIAISIGPGSFTGLRIGLSTAKGLCYALGKQLLVVSTFKAIASSIFVSTNCKKTLICIDAKQGEYYIGQYENLDNIIKEIMPVKIGNPSSIVNEINADTIIATDQINKLTSVLASKVKIEDALKYCRGDYVAKNAIQELSVSTEDSWQKVEPLYLKDFIVRKNLN